jgi:hypothetical protein|tara:strand:+ start:4411 stop:6717 length:2307 start_codon:yes stop_codon:yes gene_type:complete
MFKLKLQLLIERILSGAKPYIASHPELGVPLGIFNYKDEPDYNSRVNSILKYGTKGNPLSHKLAKFLGIELPIPSYQEDDSIDMDRINEVLTGKRKSYELTKKERVEYERILKNTKAIEKSTESSSNLTALQNVALGKSAEFYKDIQQLISSGTDSQAKMEALLSLTNRALEKEGTIRKDVVKNLGLQGQMQKTFQENIADAAILAADAGINFEETLKAVVTLSEVIGRNLSISDDTMARLAMFGKATELGADGTARIVQGFDKMGLGVDAALDKGMEMRDVAVGMGLNVGKFMRTVADNMNTINAYNFKDGVQGFTRMAAQAQRLGFGIDKVKNLMDKVIDPEGAIGLAANLQVIGGAVGDLADPFKLMYMATSDLEGLQDAMIRAGESAIMFNEETGEMGISPTEMRRMRAMAEQLGISYEDYVTSVKMAKQETIAMSQMNLAAFAGSEDAEQLQQFAASMSQFKDGKYQIELEPGKFTALEDLQSGQIELLRQSMKKDDDKDAAMSAVEEKEILFRSMTAMEAIQKEGLKAQLATELTFAKEIGPELSESIIRGFEATDFVGTFGRLMGTGLKEGLTEIISGTGDMAAIESSAAMFGDELIGALGGIFGEDASSYFRAGLEFFNLANAEGEGTIVEDYFTRGRTTISNDFGKVRTSPNDIIAAFDETQINTALPAGAIAGGASLTLEDLLPQTGGGGGGGTDKMVVDLNLSGNANLLTPNMNIDVKNLLDNNLVLMWLKDKLDQTNLTGKPTPKQEQQTGGPAFG